jgi:hypothetical protein
MDIQAVLEEVRLWCAQRTAARDPDRIEVDFHAVVCITIGESAPPWRVRWERRDSSGASSPVAQLQYDFETREWTLHHGTKHGWSTYEEAAHASEVGPLLEEVAGDRVDRYAGLPTEIWQR